MTDEAERETNNLVILFFRDKDKKRRVEEWTRTSVLHLETTTKVDCPCQTPTDTVPSTVPISLSFFLFFVLIVSQYHLGGRGSYQSSKDLQTQTHPTYLIMLSSTYWLNIFTFNPHWIFFFSNFNRAIFLGFPFIS